MWRMCSVWRGSPAGILAMPMTIWITSAMSTSRRTTPASWARSRSGSPPSESAGGAGGEERGVLGALEEWLARFEERGAAGLEELGVPVEVVEQLGCERPLGGEVRDEALEPPVQRLPGVGRVGLLGGGATDLLDLLEVERLHERLPVGEVAVERADADPGAARDLLERGRLATFGERLARRREHLLVIAARVRAAGAREEGGGRGFGGAHAKLVDKRRHPPYSSGGVLHLFRRWPPV